MNKNKVVSMFFISMMFAQVGFATAPPMPKSGKLNMGTTKSGGQAIHNLAIYGEAAQALYARLPEKDQKVILTTTGSIVRRTAKNIICTRSSGKPAAALPKDQCRLSLMNGIFGNFLIDPQSNSKPLPKPTVVTAASVDVITYSDGSQSVALVQKTNEETAPKSIFISLSDATNESGASGIKIETKSGKYISCQKSFNQKTKAEKSSCMFTIRDGEVVPQQ